MKDPAKSPARHPLTSCLALAVVGLVCGFLGLVAGGLTGLSSGGGTMASRSGLEEVLVDGEATAEKKIVIIPIKGVIMESMGVGKGSVSQVLSAVQAIEKDEHVVGVLLAIDTPGGGVTASDRIYHELKRFKDESQLPMHAFFLDVAASGGYYVAMAADNITAHPTTITGSIGVISKFYSVHEVMDKVGVSVNVIKSLNSQGEVSFKDMGSPYRPMRPEERKLIQGLVTQMWDRFTQVVAEGREGKLSMEQIQELADGRVFTGDQALELGLVDAVGYREDAFAKIREAAGAPDAKLVSLRKSAGLAELLGFKMESPAEELLGDATLARKLLGERSGFCYLWAAGER